MAKGVVDVCECKSRQESDEVESRRWTAYGGRLRVPVQGSLFFVKILLGRLLVVRAKSRRKGKQEAGEKRKEREKADKARGRGYGGERVEVKDERVKG